VNLDDTIVALATASGAAGLAVVRLTGSRALEVAARLFRGAELADSASHRAHHGYVVDAAGERLDEVLALVLRAPHGYTGEDTVEFSCHGSPQVVDELVEAALHAGARLAEPGEFTRRAFMNGKLDLCQAEAVADLIDAQSRAARRTALEQLRGRLSERLRTTREKLVALLADIEASIDFVEEGIEFFGRDEAGRRGEEARSRVEALLATADDGILLRSGVHVSFAGAPNVGKSSLFNRVLQSPRSIVTEHAGTTRDVVRETVRIGGMPMVLEDTAGLRGGQVDVAEAIGIERSRQSHRNADVVLHVLDAFAVGRDVNEALCSTGERTVVAVLNKCDLLPEAHRQAALASNGAAKSFLKRLGLNVAADVSVVALSAETGEGIDRLLDALVRIMKQRRLALQNDALVAINQRHREVLMRARQALDTFLHDVRGDEPPEILAADLRDSVAALAEISGEQISEEILDAIFSRFCLGK
jgi:tRNA modification GTPase